jgi:hypothetical protein
MLCAFGPFAGGVHTTRFSAFARSAILSVRQSISRLPSVCV